MSPSILPQLSRSELDLMKILWRDGESSVRSTHDQLSSDYDWAYSTTRTMMERMVKKNLLQRRDFHGVYLYQPLITKPAGLAIYVRDFAQRILELHHEVVVPLFARSEALTQEEVEELSRLLNEASDESQPEPTGVGPEAKSHE